MLWARHFTPWSLLPESREKKSAPPGSQERMAGVKLTSWEHRVYVLHESWLFLFLNPKCFFCQMYPNKMAGLSQGKCHLKDQMTLDIKEYKLGIPCLNFSKWWQLTLQCFLRAWGEGVLTNTWCVHVCMHASWFSLPRASLTMALLPLSTCLFLRFLAPMLGNTDALAL